MRVSFKLVILITGRGYDEKNQKRQNDQQHVVHRALDTLAILCL